MNDGMTQDARLTRLAEAFKAESDEYKDLVIPRNMDGKRRILRSLMNVRMPGSLSPDVLRMQDEYLRGRADEKGIVELKDIPVADGMMSFRNTVKTLLLSICYRAAGY